MSFFDNPFAGILVLGAIVKLFAVICALGMVIFLFMPGMELKSIACGVMLINLMQLFKEKRY